MSETNSCHQDLQEVLKKHGIIIQWIPFDFISSDIKQSDSVTILDYRTCVLKLSALIMVALVTYIVKHYPYCPVTVTGNTVYSRVTAITLARFKIPHRFCKGNNRVSYYGTEDGKEIPFEGPSVSFFAGQDNKNMTFTPCDAEQIVEITRHTQVQKLNLMQNSVLHEFGNHTSMKEFFHYPNKIYSPIVKMMPFLSKDLLLVMTASETWLTRKVFIDMVLPLQIKDIVTVLYPVEQVKPLINISDEEDKPVKLIRRAGYIVHDDLTITSFNHEVLDDYYQNECVLYSLRKARPFTHNNIYTIHPFHFPGTWDPFLGIMILTLGIVS